MGLLFYPHFSVVIADYCFLKKQDFLNNSLLNAIQIFAIYRHTLNLNSDLGDKRKKKKEEEYKNTSAIENGLRLPLSIDILVTLFCIYRI
ncbi:MAG: hypothetical protein H0A75_06930 [Candidatus Methanofishera endochildressiae]|uniref:Uncharacterized protein n=1 Tax=Candidatus Methanofishera endochildressiae TaxID=2738884 RepID=A0A7Z0MP82_9GAMM|nr:hypothetical protein [Candidatus Methanofishera endochildressiae]